MKNRILPAAAAIVFTLTPAAWAQTASPPTEAPGSGSGSSGQVPQQGIGSGATQVSPGANRPSAPQGPPKDTQHNRDYGRDTTPDGQDPNQGKPDSPKP